MYCKFHNAQQCRNTSSQIFMMLV